MPTCANGHYLPEGTAFCGVCGHDVRPRCDQGHPNNTGSRFCVRCGAPVTVPGPSPVSADTATLARHGKPSGIPSSTEDITPLLMAPPAAAPPSRTRTVATRPRGSHAAPPTPFSDDLPQMDTFPGPSRPGSSHGPGLGNGFSPLPHPASVPDQPPATVVLPSTGMQPPGTGGRHRGGPPSDADGVAARHGRSRRALTLGIVAGLVVIMSGGAAAAITLLHHHHPSGKTTAAVAPTLRASSSQAPSTPPPSASTPSPFPSPSLTTGPAGWTLPKPIDQQAYGNDEAEINSLSCVTGADCFAVDSEGNILASTAMNSWQTVKTVGQNGLTAISCASARFCAAVDNSGNVIVFSAGTWSDPVNIDSGNELTSVSCPTSTFCVAVDNRGNSFTFTGSVTQWSQTSVDPNQDEISSISCPTASFCAAADQAGDVYVYDGGAWSPADNIDSGNEFTQVSCDSAAFCVAVDNNSNAAVMTDGGWSVGSMPAQANRISCPAAGYCVVTS